MKIEKGTIKRIHVNQHNIRHNAKNPPEEALPVFTCKTSKANIKGYAVHIYGPSAVVYQPEDPLACGAKVWIQTTSEVEIFEEYTE